MTVNRHVVRLMHATWGLPQALAGAAVNLVVGKRVRRQRFRSAVVTEWSLKSGLSLGPFIFVPRGCDHRLVVHEYGHTVQSLILGPLYLPVIVVPSLVWAGVPALERRRVRRCVSYYDFFTERWANALAERVCHERSMR